MVLANEDHPSHKRPKNLSEDVVRDFLPWKALPDGKAESDSRIEVTTGSRTTSDNSKSNANCIGPTDLEKRTEGSLSAVQEE